METTQDITKWPGRFERFSRSEQSLEVVEYAVIMGLIVVAALLALVTLGQWVLGTYTTTTTRLGAGGP